MSGFTSYEQSIPVQFPRQQWEHVLTMLARQPFNEVAPLIADIQRQCQMHEMRQRAGQTPPRLAPQGYGPLDEPKVAE
jgi:hypothetical protein